MGSLLNIVSYLHNKTKRDCLFRMNDNKVECMNVAQEYDKDYWDGERRYGYGGYNYIPGYWTKVAEDLINIYKLTNNSSILDVGCGKAFLLHEIKIILPQIKVLGIDISKHAINYSTELIKKNLSIIDARKKLPFLNNEFDLVVSLATLHNFKLSELAVALPEIERVGKNKYIMVESYRNNQELFNLQCWALTAQSFFEKNEWIWLFNDLGYTGDYEFIYF